MRNIKLFITLVIALLLPACSYLKSWFPDKEKDYQYTTEIPTLKYPPDLDKQDSLAAAINQAKKPTLVMPEQVTENIAPLVTEPLLEPVANPSTDAALTDTPSAPAKHEAIIAQLITQTDGHAHLIIEEPFDTAWRVVDKALSRKSIEVTNRDKPAKLFSLRYDPNEKKLEDGSLWDEALFIFSGFQNDEKAFVVKLSSIDQQTQVEVLDKDQQPTTDPVALTLLKVLLETIKTDFAK
jgi:outer membrane protein assembly factor BamC